MSSTASPMEAHENRSPKIHVIHFDDDAENTLDDQMAPLRSAYGDHFTLTSICTEHPADWPRFVEAVTHSEADLVIPTLHGRHDRSDLGTTTRGPWRDIADVFGEGSISAQVLLLFCCMQNQWKDIWRSIAPRSTLVLSASKDTNAIDGIVSELVTSNGDIIRPTPMSPLGDWHIHAP